MKVSVLVAAAMAIASVSASGRGQPKGFLKKSGGMTGSESKANLVIDDDSESGPSQKSPRRGVKQRLLQSSFARKLRSVFPSKSQRHKLTPFQEPIKEYSICDLIVVELSLSRDKIHDLDHEFWTHSPYFYDLMTGNGGEMSEEMSVDYEEEEDYEEDDEEDDEDDEEKKINAEALRVETIQEWIESNSVAIPGLQEIKAEHISLKENHFVIWKKLLDNDCLTEGLEHLSPEGMERRGYFSKWDFETNLMRFGEQ
ncbi:hypothetical protein BASA61_006191 [Batrachochytrium salamandrivorans]|nr:hypothetical protein BASA60_003584 [Batrachochytrium salamandrivorans]KAH6579091.1 hypothetical protein BASA60_003403 [Batrachochytrium salamandrivorans]KAH6587838.1 hypothetical protein BASA61_006191 [Batrachochytrium salamandrivorans]